MNECDAERMYFEELRRRPDLTDEQFYDTFFAGSQIPKEIPVRLRRLYQEIFGYDFSALNPNDNIALIFDFVDFADVLYRIEREFGLKIPLSACKSDGGRGKIDGTFDSVVRYLNEALHPDEQDRLLN
jgi:hypothetical protein